MKFRPCIDLHGGVVKQIVGSTLKDVPADGGTAAAAAAATEKGAPEPVTNFKASHSSAHYAEMYKRDGLDGGHVIMLGPGNESAALEALAAYPGGMQVGGGIKPANAKRYLDAGASHVIVTSYVFRDGAVDFDRLQELVDTVGRDRLVLDLSCRRRPGAEVQGSAGFFVVTDRWQKFTDFELTQESVHKLAGYCAEFLVHGVDVEGMRVGVIEELVAALGEWSPIPVTYAGGARSIDDLETVKRLGSGRVDLTIGSALDIFGGDLKWDDVLAWHRAQEASGESEAAGIGAASD